MTNIIYPNGVNSTFGYDAESRVIGFSHGTFHDREIIRDARGYKTIENIVVGLDPVSPEGEQRFEKTPPTSSQKPRSATPGSEASSNSGTTVIFHIMKMGV